MEAIGYNPSQEAVQEQNNYDVYKMSQDSYSSNMQHMADDAQHGGNVDINNDHPKFGSSFSVECPDHRAFCPDNHTCCRQQDSQWGCCEFRQVTIICVMSYLKSVKPIHSKIHISIVKKIFITFYSPVSTNLQNWNS